MKEQLETQKRQREIENMYLVETPSSPVSSPQLLELPSIQNSSSPRKKQNNLETSDGVQQACGAVAVAVAVAPIQITAPGFSASPLLESSNNKDNNPAICNPQDSNEQIFQDFDEILEDFLGNDPLKEEIWTINQLIGTFVEICDENGNSTTAAAYMKDSQAKIVKCTYRDLATIVHSLLSENASENPWPIQPLKLLIPGTYPNQSPLVLDKLSTLAGDGMKNDEDLTGKAISILKLQLESFEQPLSLEKIVKAWDDVVRDVVHEYSNQLRHARYGRYGVWRGMCAPAS